MVSKAERRLLAQTAIIALYDIGTNLPWVLGVTLPETRLTYFIIEMTWVVSAAINPIVYFVLNRKNFYIILNNNTLLLLYYL